MSAAVPAPSTADLTGRLTALARLADHRGIDAVMLCPGADMRYFLGHSVPSHERLTCVIIPVDGSPRLVVPALEEAGWAGSPVAGLDLAVSTWQDGEDPYQLVADLLPSAARVLGVDDHMPAAHVLATQQAVTGSEMRLAGEMIAELRMRKDDREIEALRSVAGAIDRVHARMGEWLRAGRTENEVAADIEAAIIADGHERADFVIVGSGPNGASPHHRASDRMIGAGELVVVDIGGPAPSGYNSDSTRTYLTAGAEPDAQARTVYDLVRRAHAAGVAAVRPGATAESVDAAARAVIVASGYGEYFITRTGHGIGLEVHEHPYIVAGNTDELQPGMTFSVEPGIYLPGRFGVRIEDIVLVTDTGVERLNNAPTELLTVG